MVRPAYPTVVGGPVFIERTSVGLDVHARSVAAAAIDGVTGELFQTKLSPGNDRILEWVRSVPGPVAVAYEAGPTGFGLFRALNSAGIRCVVAAPSKLQRPSGDRVKTDARDAVHLARLLRLDEVTPVSVPTADQEAARDLVRAREDCRGDLMRARHRLSKLLLRHGIVYDDGAAWTTKHDRWLAQQRLPGFASQAAFDAEYETVLQIKARRDRMDRAIEALAVESEFAGGLKLLLRNRRSGLRASGS
jgi:transposase